MLILTRKPGESLYIGDNVKVTIVEIKGNQIRVGIEAPRDLRIYREEIYLQILEENRSAAEAAAGAMASLDEFPVWPEAAASSAVYPAGSPAGSPSGTSATPGALVGRPLASKRVPPKPGGLKLSGVSKGESEKGKREAHSGGSSPEAGLATEGKTASMSQDSVSGHRGAGPTLSVRSVTTTYSGTQQTPAGSKAVIEDDRPGGTARQSPPLGPPLRSGKAHSATVPVIQHRKRKGNRDERLLDSPLNLPGTAEGAASVQFSSDDSDSDEDDTGDESDHAEERK